MKQTSYIIGIFVTLWVVYDIIGTFRSYIIGAYFVTLSGDLATLSASCYIISKFGVTLSVDVTLSDVVTSSGITKPRIFHPEGIQVLFLPVVNFSKALYLFLKRLKFTAQRGIDFLKL